MEAAAWATVGFRSNPIFSRSSSFRIGPSGKSSCNAGLRGSCVGRGGVGDAIGICIPGVIACGLGDGEAVGICMPGVITSVGPVEGEGAVAFFDGVLFLRGVAFFFLGGLLGFGLLAGFIFDMSCP